MTRHQKIRNHMIKKLLAKGVTQVDGKPVDKLTDRALVKALTKH